MDDAAGDAGTGVTGGLGGEVVGFRMHNHCTSDDGGIAGKSEVAVDPFQPREAIFIGLEVAQITDMALLVLGAGVGFSCGIEMASGGCGIRRGTISIFMDVESMLSIGGQPGDLGNNADAFRFLGESHGPCGFIAFGGRKEGHCFGGSTGGSGSELALALPLAAVMSMGMILIVIMVVVMIMAVGGLLAGTAAE